MNKKNTLVSIFFSAFCLLNINNASATIIYDEAVNGDLDAIGSANVSLVAGLNQIKGSIEQTPPADSDRITFTQVDNLVIDSIVLSFSGIFDDANIGQSMNSALFNSTANLFDDSFNSIDSGSNIVASFYDSFGSEQGALSQDIAGTIWDFQLSAGIVWPAQPWMLTIITSDITPPTVPSIPEPSTMAIFMLALTALVSRKLKASN